MRYLAVGLAIALLVSVPAAVAGPDALSLAKRALRLAKEPPEVARIHTGNHTNNGNTVTVRGYCPRGMIAMSVAPDPGAAEFLYWGFTGGREGVAAVFQRPEVMPFQNNPTIEVMCMEARLR